MSARKEGVSCSAMTFWALLGSFFWDKLVTCDNGHYEHGVFELRDGKPIETELARLISDIAEGCPPSHRALAVQGWWRSEQRFHF
jgi:hypothetical protein